MYFSSADYLGFAGCLFYFSATRSARCFCPLAFFSEWSPICASRATAVTTDFFCCQLDFFCALFARIHDFSCADFLEKIWTSIFSSANSVWVSSLMMFCGFSCCHSGEARMPNAGTVPALVTSEISRPDEDVPSAGTVRTQCQSLRV
jgi:hypothetical protein